jgi:RimJ/RimL family protein N-acetyltransferase
VHPHAQRRHPADGGDRGAGHPGGDHALTLRLPDPPLRDKAVLLRELAAADLGRLVEGCRDPLTQRFTRLPRDYTEADGRAFIEGARGRRTAGTSLELAISAPPDERLKGVVGIVIDRHDPLRAEIGYWVSPDARGAGFAGRALALLSRWALVDLGLRRLDLLASVENPASLRTAERCGYVREGTLRDAWHRGPAPEDMALLSLLRRDLET